MKIKLLSQLVFFFAMSVLLLTSCKKDDNETAKPSSVDENLVLAERTFNDIGNMTSSAFAMGKGKYKSGESTVIATDGCLNISFDLTSSPYKLVLDFGNTNCLCEDGLYRRGKILVSFTASYGDSLASFTTTLENYFVNDNQVTGSRTISFKGHNAAGNLNWDVAVNGSVILASGEGTITYQSAHNTEMTAGEYSLDYTDNIYSITGSANGTAITGQSFSTVITTPLVSKTTCPHFVSGIVEITPSSQPVRVLNYGSGECDNLATITVSGITFNITLP